MCTRADAGARSRGASLLSHLAEGLDELARLLSEMLGEGEPLEVHHVDALADALAKQALTEDRFTALQPGQVWQLPV